MSGFYKYAKAASVGMAKQALEMPGTKRDIGINKAKKDGIPPDQTIPSSVTDLSSTNTVDTSSSQKYTDGQESLTMKYPGAYGITYKDGKYYNKNGTYIRPQYARQIIQRVDEGIDAYNRSLSPVKMPDGTWRIPSDVNGEDRIRLQRLQGHMASNQDLTLPGWAGDMFANAKTADDVQAIMDYLSGGNAAGHMEELAGNIAKLNPNLPVLGITLGRITPGEVKANIKRNIGSIASNTDPSIALGRLKSKHPELYSQYTKLIGDKHTPQMLLNNFNNMADAELAKYGALMAMSPEYRSQVYEWIRQNVPQDAVQAKAYWDKIQALQGRLSKFNANNIMADVNNALTVGVILGDKVKAFTSQDEATRNKALADTWNELRGVIPQEIAAQYPNAAQQINNAGKAWLNNNAWTPEQRTEYFKNNVDLDAFTNMMLAGQMPDLKQAVIIKEYLKDPKHLAEFNTMLTGKLQDMKTWEERGTAVENLKKFRADSPEMAEYMGNIDPTKLSFNDWTELAGLVGSNKGLPDFISIDDKGNISVNKEGFSKFNDDVYGFQGSAVEKAVTSHFKDNAWKYLWNDPRGFLSFASKQGFAPGWVGKLTKNPMAFWGVVLGGGALATFGIAALVRSMLGGNDDDDEDEDNGNKQMVAMQQAMMPIPQTTNFWRA